MDGDSVAILCPISESVSPTTFQSVVALASYASAHGIKINHVGVTERTLVDSARNVLAGEFLKTGTEWAMWLDADMVFPKETITQLMSTAKKNEVKMVTGIYYQRGGRHFPVLWKRDVDLASGKQVVHEDHLKYDQNEYVGTYALPGPKATKPFVVDTAGFGCTLIHRSVFELLDRPYFQFLPGKCSEDFYFFVSAKNRGFTLLADPVLDLKHIGEPKLIGREDCYKYLDENKVELEEIK